MKSLSRFSTLFFILLVLITGCSPQPFEGPVGTTGTPTREWELKRVKRATGRVVLAEPINLSFPISGQVVALPVKEGDSVTAGEEIATLDTTALESEIEQAEAALAVAEAHLKKVMTGAHPALIKEAEVRVDAAAANRPLTLVQATEQAASLSAAQAQLEYLLAQPFSEDVAVAQAEVAQAKTRLNAARARLDQTVLAAPVNGTITKIFVHAHEYAWTGQAIVQMSDLSRLNVEVTLMDYEVTSMKIGDLATIGFESAEPGEVEAIITSMQPEDSKDGASTFIITLSLKNPPQEIRWGMSAEVDFPSR